MFFLWTAVALARAFGELAEKEALEVSALGKGSRPSLHSASLIIFPPQSISVHSREQEAGVGSLHAPVCLGSACQVCLVAPFWRSPEGQAGPGKLVESQELFAR